MKWDGQTYVDFIKNSLMFLLGYEEKEKAQTLSHNEFTTVFRNRHRGITQELFCKQDKVTMTCQCDGIDFDFHRPLNNLGDTVIKLTWSMAARHIRYWVKEEASEYHSKQEKALQDYERVIHTKLGDDELVHEYNFRCGENAAKKKFNEQAICCAKELYSRGLKHSLTNEHLEMFEIYSETLSPMDTKSETEEKEMTAAFNLGAMLSAPTIGESQITQIPCEMLIPYHNHKFELYSGERLDDMVESIKENGVLIPIIVQPLDGKYEILIGHNRWNASKLAGKDTVPAIIKDGLTEDEAEMYVIESNLMQRGFDDLKISEQAAVIAMRHSKMFSQGKRNDIRRELEQMNHIDEPTDTNRELGEEYGMSRAKIARLVRIDKLYAPIKEYVDNGKLSIRAAVELSYTSDKAQTSIANLLDSFKIDEAKAHIIRENGAETEDGIIRLLTLDVKQPKPRTYKLNGERFGHFFEEGTTSDEIENIIERALTAYFGEQQTLDLSDV